MKFKKYSIIFIILFVFVAIKSISSFFADSVDLHKILVNDNCVNQVLFTPKNNITDVIVELIKSEKKSIKIASFLLSEKKIINALIYAKKENKLKIELVIDQISISKSQDRINLLKENGIEIFIFDGKKKKYVRSKIIPIMHHKFLIFEQNFENKSVVCTGSFNLTYTAQKFNKENMFFTENKEIINAFNNQFEDLKKESENLKIIKKSKNKKRIKFEN